MNETRSVTAYEVGTPVWLNGETMEGVITAVTFDETPSPMYQVAYWYGGERKTVLVHGFEIKVGAEMDRKLGFRPKNTE